VKSGFGPEGVTGVVGVVGSTGAGVVASFQKHCPASLRHSVATSPAHTLTEPAAEVDPAIFSQEPPCTGLVGSAGLAGVPGLVGSTAASYHMHLVGSQSFGLVYAMQA